MSRRYSRALITGINGQDGAWLAAHLLAEGITVIGTHRPTSPAGNWRLQELGFVNHPNLHLRALDSSNVAACRGLLNEIEPQAIFHLAGQSRVADSFRDPLGSIHANGISTLNLLEAMRRETPDAHFVLAASAEIFGNPEKAPQDEETPLYAASPYGLSKLLAHSAMRSWRSSFGLAASSAILFNHESELRDEAFVTRKISLGVARILLGREEELALGNLDARRDFGYAPEIKSGKVRIRVDTRLLRPVDAPLLVGNAAKARELLGFDPRIELGELTRRMVEADLQRERSGRST